MLPNQQSETAIAFLHAARRFDAQHGTSSRRLLTDNGSCYRSRQFRAACLQLGIQQRFTLTYTPRTNGKAELFIQTLASPKPARGGVSTIRQVVSSLRQSCGRAVASRENTNPACHQSMKS